MKISIITPSFNQADWLRLAVASVADQVSVEEDAKMPKGRNAETNTGSSIQDFNISGFQDFSVEHLVMDGGSTDGTVLLLKAWEQKTDNKLHHPSGTDTFHLGKNLGADASCQRQPEPHAEMNGYFFHSVSEPDAGMYDAINKGLNKAEGHILAYLNCDEQYLPETLARVARHFDSHPETDLLFGDALLVDENGKALSYRRMVRPDRWHTRLCHLSSLSCAMFFRRRVWESGTRFPVEYRMIGDAVFVERILAMGFRAAVLPEALASFAFTGVNQGQSQRAREEAGQWRRGPDAPPGWLMKPVSCLHRFRKLMAGAYAKRDLDYALFTARSAGKRQLFRAEGLGWNWPG